jgi:hypothetical protein
MVLYTRIQVSTILSVYWVQVGAIIKSRITNIFTGGLTDSDLNFIYSFSILFYDFSVINWFKASNFCD